MKSELKKKEEMYIRKMNNEIRVLEWKPKRVYKTDNPKLNPREFAMEIAQENSKLRDTDKDGNGRCISCNTFCSWWWLAGWHRYSRRFQNICIHEHNINAQCHTCNYTTWPRGDTVAKTRVNCMYDENLDKKYGEWTATNLNKLVKDWFKWEYEKYDWDYEIPRLIELNEKLRKEKSFYAPKQKWREKWIRWRNSK